VQIDELQDDSPGQRVGRQRRESGLAKARDREDLGGQVQGDGEPAEELPIHGRTQFITAPSLAGSGLPSRFCRLRFLLVRLDLNVQLDVVPRSIP
jgi:hypothetical protein